jgi:hypothetical protein
MAFVSASLATDRRFKCLTVTDDFSHECVDIAVVRVFGAKASFAASGPLALLGSAFYAQFLFIGSRFMLHASSPHSVALVQLRFASFVVINLRRDLHP